MLWKSPHIVLDSVSFDYLSSSFPFVENVKNPKVCPGRMLLEDMTLWKKHLLHLKIKNDLACLGGGKALSFLLRTALLTCFKTAELLVLTFEWGCQKGTNKAVDKVHREGSVLPPQSSQAGQGEHQLALLDDLTFRMVCCQSCKRLKSCFHL